MIIQQLILKKHNLDKCDEDFEMIQGRFISEKDIERMASNVVISDDAAKQFFGNADPIGKPIQLQNLRTGLWILQ